MLTTYNVADTDDPWYSMGSLRSAINAASGAGGNQTSPSIRRWRVPPSPLRP